MEVEVTVVVTANPSIHIDKYKYSFDTPVITHHIFEYVIYDILLHFGVKKNLAASGQEHNYALKGRVGCGAFGR